jgi:hypothetical protein
LALKQFYIKNVGPAKIQRVQQKIPGSSKMKTNFKKSGVKQYIILNTSRKHFNYEEDKNKVTMNKPYNIQNTNICNGILHISFFKALLINEGETTRGEQE